MRKPVWIYTHNTVKNNEEKGIEYVKTVEEWIEYKTKNNIDNDDKKENYMKYGTAMVKILR